MVIFGKQSKEAVDEKKIAVAYVQEFQIKNPVRSYLFMDEGILKFYNHTTGEVKAVSVS